MAEKTKESWDDELFTLGALRLANFGKAISKTQRGRIYDSQEARFG